MITFFRLGLSVIQLLGSSFWLVLEKNVVSNKYSPVIGQYWSMYENKAYTRKYVWPWGLTCNNENVDIKFSVQDTFLE